MLQRAASNAYSWWWASHIRTKQSKWLEQNLQDMEEKVQIMLKLISEDGDSFAKRAEMYYRKRPELISFVEESYRAYRALAERYDHISTELQNANHTLATVFPEQVQLSMDEEDEDAAPRVPKKTPAPSDIPKNIPKAPKDPLKELKVIFSSATASKKLKSRTTTKSSVAATIVKSGLSKPQAVEEIDKLQKEILALQTEKEFVKSSYENSVAKYWDIDENIKQKHERICKLQDEFGTSSVIEDDEARSLMAAAALKSCHETLAQLQEKQERAAKDADTEKKRVRDFWEKLSSMKNDLPQNQTNKVKLTVSDEATEWDRFKSSDEGETNLSQSRCDVDLLRQKIKESIEAGFGTSLSVTEMAEKIDELVNKVISLETAISSQTALVNRLREENDDLQSHIWILEDDKESVVNDTSNMSNRLREMEVKYSEVKELSKNVEDQNNNLQTHFTDAQCNLDHLSEKLCTIKPDAEIEITRPKADAKLEINGPSSRAESPLGEATVKEERLKENATSLISGFEGLQSLKPDDELGATGTSITAEVNLEEEAKRQNDALDLDSSETHQENTNQDKELKVEELLANDKIYLEEVKPHEENKEQETLDLGKISEEDKNTLVASPKHIIEDDVKSLGKGDPQYHSEKFIESNIQGKTNEQASSDTPGNRLDITPRKQATDEEDEPDWRELFMNGMENREKTLLNEYTTILRNYKDVKKKLNEVETKLGNSLTNTKLRDLKSANAMKDDEIRSLRRKLSLMHRVLDENKDVKKHHTPTHHRNSNLLDDVNIESLATTTLAQEDEESEDTELTPIQESQIGSPIEQKFRMNIDELLEQNLDFWLRFSTSFGQIQKFESEVADLQAELSKVEERGAKQEGNSSAKYNLKSDIRPIYKHLSEIYAELSVWLEKSVLLKDELKSRFSSLCDIQEEIKTALRESAEEDDFIFTSYQAAKFQGEVLNMKQENNKVADELQAGLDHVTTLQLEVDRTLAKLNEDFKLSGSKKEVNPQLIHSDSRSRIPLRSFIFGVKPKRQKQSLFACVSPVLYRKHNNRAGNSL